MKALNVAEFTRAWTANQLTVEQLAEQYGTSANAIRTAAKNLGLPRRNKAAGRGSLPAGRWVFEPRRRIHVWEPGDKAAS